MDPSARSLRWAYIGLLVAILSWAGNATVARGSVGSITPFALAFWRWFLALLLLSPFVMRQVVQCRSTIFSHWKQLLPLSLFSVSAYNTFLYLAAQHTTAINITLISSAVPAVILFFAWALLGNPVTKLSLAGISISFFGVLYIISKGEISVLLNLSLNRGDLLMVCGVAAWALYSVLLRKFKVDLPPLCFLWVQIAIGTPFILPFYLWEVWDIPHFAFSGGNIAVLAYVAILPSLVAYRGWNHGVHTVGPAKASMFIYLLPVFTAILAVIFLSEQLHGFHLTGGLLVISGLVLANRAG